MENSARCVGARGSSRNTVAIWKMRSMPPTSRRFMANSGEVCRKPRAVSSNGLMCGSRPGQGTRMGVRVSRKSRASKKARIPASTARRRLAPCTRR
jgi:hypothetical protein